MDLYVSNLSSSVNDSELKSLFAEYGPIISAKIIVDKTTGRSRGFGFVTMTKENAVKAMNGLNGKYKDGKSMSITEAKPRT